MRGGKHKERFGRMIDAAAVKIAKTVRPEYRRPVIGSDLPIAERVERTLSELTMEEKIGMLGGIDSMGIRGVERLGLPMVWCSDASSGVRCFGPGTAFPALMGMAASWNVDLMEVVGRTIGAECRAIGVSVLLGPGVNICRVPTCGRNFEYMGEDPYLSGRMVVPYIRGVQSQGVAATVKHFACNNSDYDRHRMNAVIDERTLREIYLPAFEAAVRDGGVCCVMSSYNPVNGTYASENHRLLNGILKGEWGFKGFVMSDWNSVYGSKGALKGGLDLEMPSGVYMNRERILPLLADRSVSRGEVDDKIRRMLGVFFETGTYGRETIDGTAEVRGPVQREIALRAACESIVLLENRGVLPLDRDSVRRIALVGKNAIQTPTGGGGSSYMRVDDPENIYDEMVKACGDATEVRWFEDRKGRFAAADREWIASADAVIACVGFDHILESEGYDRSWALPERQGRLVRTVSALNPKTVVLLTAGGDVETSSWSGGIGAFLHTFYLGCRAGSAVAAVLFGDVNPSGRLPFSMAESWRDHPAVSSYVRIPDRTNRRLIEGPRSRRHTKDVPAERLEMMRRETWQVPYREGIFFGYRHFDTGTVEPAYPFGFGLSYTSFSFSSVSLSAERIAAGAGVGVKVTVQNTGSRRGAEVVQVYVGDDESSIARPIKELKGFAKVTLDPGEERTVEIGIDARGFSFYHPDKGGWTVEPGVFTVYVATSARDIAWTGKLTVGEPR